MNAVLSWTAGPNTTSHDVNFGTTSPPPFIVNQGPNSFDPCGAGPMSYNTTYYWRINEKNAGGTTTGVIWNFKTNAQVPSVVNIPLADANSATTEILDGQLALDAYDAENLKRKYGLPSEDYTRTAALGHHGEAAGDPAAARARAVRGRNQPFDRLLPPRVRRDEDRPAPALRRHRGDEGPARVHPDQPRHHRPSCSTRSKKAGCTRRADAGETSSATGW